MGDWYEKRETDTKRLGDEGLVDAFGYHGSAQPLSLDDVEAIDKSWTSGGDEPDWVWLLCLKDGRFATAKAWHDYTGWDCQSDLTTSVHATREEAIRWGLTLNDRDNLGVLLPDDQPAPSATPSTEGGETPTTNTETKR